MYILDRFSIIPLLLVLIAPFWSVSFTGLFPLFLFFAVIMMYKNVAATLREWWVIFALMIQYPLWNMVKIAVSSDTSILYFTYAARYEMWIWQILLSVVFLLYFINQKSISYYFEFLAPVFVLGTAIAAGTVYFITGVCRIDLLTPIVFTPPMIATTITLLYIAMTQMRTPAQTRWAFVMIASSVLLSTAFSGTRGIFLAQFCAYGAVFLVFLTRAPRRALVIAIAAFGATALGYGIDNLAQCSFSMRSMNMMNTPEDMMVADNSIRLRLMMWDSAWEVISQYPLWGLGPLAEPIITQPGFTHVHNMYLSWLIWGGVFSLASGLLFLMTPLFARHLGIAPIRILLFSIATTIFWAASMIFDSFLVWPHYSYLYAAYFALALRLARDAEASDPENKAAGAV